MNFWPLLLLFETFSSTLFRKARHRRDSNPPINHHLWASTAPICSPTTPPSSIFLNCTQVLRIPPEANGNSRENGKVQEDQHCCSGWNHGHIIVIVDLHGVDKMRNLQPMLLSLYLHLCCCNRLFSPPPPYNTEPLEVQGVKEEEGGGVVGTQ